MVIAEKDKQLSHLQRIVQEMRLPLSKSEIVEEQYQTKVGGFFIAWKCEALNSAKVACVACIQLVQTAVLDFVV